MAYLPQVNSIKTRQYTQEEFRGYNHNVFLDNAELYDMKNMSSDHYPYATPRKRRGIYKDGQGNVLGTDFNGIATKNGLCFCEKGGFYYKAKGEDTYKMIGTVSYDSSATEEANRKQFVVAGAYILIFPDKKYFWTVMYEHYNDPTWLEKHGLERQDFYGSLEASAEFNWIKMSMCNVYGDDYSIDYTQASMPDDETNGKKWLDISSAPAKLMQYSSTYSGWVEITTPYIKVTVPGRLNNFFDYDGVTLSGFPEPLKDYNGSHVIYTVYDNETGNSFFVLSGLLDLKSYGNGLYYDPSDNSLVYYCGERYVQSTRYNTTMSEPTSSTETIEVDGETVLKTTYNTTLTTIETRTQEVVYTQNISVENINPQNDYRITLNIGAKDYIPIFKSTITPDDVFAVEKIKYKLNFYEKQSDSLVLIESKTFEDIFTAKVPTSSGYTKLGSTIEIKRTVPDMDFVCEQDGRLWGCSSDDHMIYASQAGYPFNFNVFLNLASDSYALPIGSDGDFTACVPFMGYVLFFKEDMMHKIYGTKPSNYQLTNLAVRGVQKGCDRSLSIVNETLLYKSRVGIMAFTGSMPECISNELGEVAYGEAVAAAVGNKYYVSMKRGNEYVLFAYDINFGLWHKEDNTQFKHISATMNDLFYIDGNGALCSLLGSGDTIKIDRIVSDTSQTPPVDTTVTTTYTVQPEGEFDWSLESGDLYISGIDNKYASRLRVLFNIFKDTTISVFLKYDNDKEWKRVATKKYKYSNNEKNTYNLPITPRRARRLRIKISGTGNCDIQAVAMNIEQGSEL